MRSYVNYVTISNKILYYTFETAVNDSWGTNNGTDVNNNSRSTGDKYAGSYSAYFNGVLSTIGTSYRIITIPSIAYGSGGISVAFWMKRIGNSSTDYHIFAIGKFYLWGGGSSGFFRVSADGNSEFTFPNNVWTHVTVTLNTSSQACVYVNGSITKNNVAVADSQTGGSVYPNPTTTITGRIGGVLVGNGGANLNGYIDEFRVYNKVLTQAEVTAIYTNTAL